ncbi:MAG: type II toxin-antitoxin system RelE/ParE family toxin [Acidobacteriia bacterium]|nr:type II toxin-antitoxin system RelE/ParE family toxin [Terriglobia bacterium]
MAFEIRFKDESLEKLERDARLDTAYQAGIGKTFRKRMQVIRAAADERDFYALKSLHFEKLKGKREHQRSMMLNDQWRLIVEIVEGNPNKIFWIVGIEDYH